MLPQPRLRFLLADDPGAGKTIMAGLLIKEMKLREAIDRVLILCPAPLTIQWQDEMLRWFGESFDIIFSAVDQQQLVNPWHRSSQVIASLDYAKQDDVRERVWSERWDLVIIDEAHKCSAYTKSSSGRGDEVEKTKRYQLAERLAANADHLLLLTATPHHGDDDRFAHFIRLIDSDLFPEPHRVGNKATRDPPRHPPARPGLPVGAAPAEGRPARPAGPSAVSRPARAHRRVQAEPRRSTTSTRRSPPTSTSSCRRPAAAGRRASPSPAPSSNADSPVRRWQSSNRSAAGSKNSRTS